MDHAAHAFVEVLDHLGVEVFLAVLGSDAPSIMDAFARFRSERRDRPRAIQVAHEAVAMSAAHGYYLASGKPAVVMVHSTVGTANALTGLINASRDRVPLVLVAGRTAASATGGRVPRTLEPHWAQEVSDQGAMVRQYAKWDYELRRPDQIADVVRRAFAIAMSEPRGPVYLALPMDLMAEPGGHLDLGPAPGELFGAAVAPYPDPRALEQVAEWLAGARHPLLITRSLGRRPEAVAPLVDLAELFALPVVEYQVADHVSFPSSHPLHLGYDPHPYLDEADVVVTMDCPVPWVPALGDPSPTARVVHLGSDPLWTDFPQWSFRTDLAVTGDVTAALHQLVLLLRRRQRASRATIEQRRRRIRDQHQRLRRSWNEEVRRLSQERLSSAAWVSHCVGQLLDRDAVLVQEYDLKLAHVGLDRLGSYFGFSPSGGLGFGVGGALGVKLALPEKTVVSVVGDGTYLLGVPVSAHLLSTAADLPVLWVVVNNHGWGAVRTQNQLVHPQGWVERSGDLSLVRFGCDVRFELLCRACEGAGEAVQTAAALPDALERALAVVRREGRQALLNVECGEPTFRL